MAKNQISKNSLKKLLDSVTPMAPDAAEKFVRDLLKVGDERRRDAEKVVAEVAAVARRSAEQFSVTVREEVAKQLGDALRTLAIDDRALPFPARPFSTWPRKNEVQ